VTKICKISDDVACVIVILIVNGHEALKLNVVADFFETLFKREQLRCLQWRVAMDDGSN